MQQSADTAPNGTQISDLALIGAETAACPCAGSAGADFLTLCEIATDGSLTAPVAHWMQESLPVQCVSVLETLDVAGQDFPIVAAPESSSLLGLAVSESGGSRGTIHLIVSTACFQKFAQLENVSAHGFLLAWGAR